MKKLVLTFIAFICIGNFANGQTIPNNAFELWNSQTSIFGFELPENWIPVSNSIALSFGSPGPVSVSKNNNGRSGFALQLSTVNYQNAAYRGVAYSGTLDFSKIASLSDIKGGYPFTAKPSVFKGFFKYTSVENDSATIATFLTKFNGTSRDTIAKAVFSIKNNITEFTEFSVQFSYSNPGIDPDTCIIAAVSSGSAPKVGSTLVIDDLSFEGNFLNAFKPQLTNFTKAYPNPASEVLVLSNVPAKAASVEVTDIQGRIIERVQADDITNLNVWQYKDGLYYYSVRDKEGNLLYNDKFSVIK